MNGGLFIMEKFLEYFKEFIGERRDYKKQFYKIISSTHRKVLKGNTTWEIELRKLNLGGTK